MRTRYWYVCHPDPRTQGQVVMAGPKFVFGMLSKGPAASRSCGTGLGALFDGVVAAALFMGGAQDRLHPVLLPTHPSLIELVRLEEEFVKCKVLGMVLWF